MTRSTHAHPLRRALAPAAVRPGWRSAGVLALLCSTVAWASLPPAPRLPTAEQRQWQALAIAPLSSGGGTGMRMAPTDAVETIEFAPRRAVVAEIVTPLPKPKPAGRLRIRGRAGDGLYWALRTAGGSTAVATDRKSVV